MLSLSCLVIKDLYVKQQKIVVYFPLKSTKWPIVETNSSILAQLSSLFFSQHSSKVKKTIASPLHPQKIKSENLGSLIYFSK